MSLLCPQCQRLITLADPSLSALICPHCGGTVRLDLNPTIDHCPSDLRGPPEPFADGVAVGPYRLQRPLGRGGIGIVYEALDSRLGRRVAIKILSRAGEGDHQRLKRFHREARAASALNHPNICTVFDVGEHCGRPFIVMELVEGKTFRRLAERPIPPKTLAQLGRQVAAGVAAAHAAGVVHRDIKPLNLMVRSDGYVKVLDFGLALLLSTSAVTLASDEPISTTEMVMGTVGYMSPEQARGDAVDAASDIFSLGVTFYELVTGKHPFPAASPLDMMHAILKDSPLPPSRLNPEVSLALDELICRMLEKQAERRPSAAEVELSLTAVANESAAPSAMPSPIPCKRHTVGREKERSEFRAAFQSSTTGRGRLLCVEGEPGIGKTTLVEDAISELAHAASPFTVARGRCSERLAGTEAYMPILEALDSLLHGEGSESTARALKLLAPSWYTQIAPVSPNQSASQVDPRAGGSQERMKRELGAFLQEISHQKPLILFLDDLQWADASTVDLLAYLAARFDVLRLLIVAAYRPSDLLLVKHPFLSLKLEMTGRGLCQVVAIEFLSLLNVEQYLTLELSNPELTPELARLVHAKTEGNALFMVDLARYLRDRGVLVEAAGRWILARPFPDVEKDLPASVRGMIERKIGQVRDQDRRVLIAASVQGYEFDSAIVAQALGTDPAEVEERLEFLDRVLSFVQRVAEQQFPDRTLSVRYRFVHLLYQNVLYGILQPTRRTELSGMVAQALLGHYGEHSNQVASELAGLFETARDPERAAEFYAQAAQNATQVFAHAEAVALARRGLAQVQVLRESDDRDRLELRLQLTMGLSFARGYTSAESGKSLSRARELCLKLGEHAALCRALVGMAAHALVGKGGYEVTHQLAEELLALTRDAHDPFLLVGVHGVMGFMLGYHGEPVLAYEHLKRAISFFNPDLSRNYKTFYGLNPGIYSMGQAARILWRLGYADQARRRIVEAMALAAKDQDTRTLAFAHWCVAHLHLDLAEAEELQKSAEEGIAHCNKYGIMTEPLWLTVVLGWAIAERGARVEGIDIMRDGLNDLRAAGSGMMFPLFCTLMADQLAKAGRTEECAAVLDEGFRMVEENGQHYWDAELYRHRGELLELVRQQKNCQTAAATTEHSGPDLPTSTNAEGCFREALAIARQQGAKSLELRAATSLARLLQNQARKHEAKSLLANVYNWFTEGFDTADLRKAKALLEELV